MFISEEISGRPVAVRLTSAGPLFYYQAADLDLFPGDRVLVETGPDQGTTIATVILTGAILEVADFEQPLPRIIERLENRPSQASPAVGPPVVKMPCNRQPCCQNWQSRFNPAGTGCTLLICTARFEPGLYQQMRQGLPETGERLCGPVGTKPVPSNKDIS